MACQAVQMWSLSGLVAAFLDLTIAYLLLCASAAAYFASKFLGFFGLNLPCPCDGMFINVHSRSLCFNRLLVEFPIQKLSDVQLSVRQKFPFSNSISLKRYDCSVVGDNCGNGIIELEGDASCSSSVSDARGSADAIWGKISPREGKIHMKGKGILSHKPKSRLRNRRWVGGYGNSSSLLSYDSSVNEDGSDSQKYHHFNINKRGSWCSADSLLLPTDNAGNLNLEYDSAPKKIRRRLGSLSRDEMDLSPDEDMHMKESMPSGEEQQCNQPEVQSCGGDENSKIRLLEQALERERAARAAVYTELEMERSAAASAADEAMAMILRLQKEKASVEMEARQYQRIIEEKSAYDDEEMDILQEILMRREKEKLFLEKEVEAYREMVSRGNETCDFSDNNDTTQIFTPPDYPNDVPVVFASPTDEKEKLENKYADDVFASQFKYKPPFGIESPPQPNDEQSSFERVRDSNEKSVDVSIHNSSGEDMQLMPKAPPEFEKAIPCYTKELDQIQELDQHKHVDRVISTCYGTEKGDLNYTPSSKQQAQDASLGYCSSCDPTLDKAPHDVHVIGDGINSRSEATADKGEQLPVSTSLKERRIDCVQSGAAQERINVNTDSFVKKSSSEVTSCLPPIGRRASSQSLRRSSMSSLDTEMLKIDSEIIQLRERLKLVKEGREKLSFSLENREKNIQLNILEDIARQIQELRRHTEPQRAARQASLPLPNAKGLSKRRRSRSVSSGFQMSSEG